MHARGGQGSLWYVVHVCMDEVDQSVNVEASTPTGTDVDQVKPPTRAGHPLIL
jgi:hypothetical protein